MSNDVQYRSVSPAIAGFFVDALVTKLGYTFSRACSISAMISLTCSMPTEILTRSSGTPAATNS